MDVVTLSLHGIEVEGVPGHIATVLLDRDQVRSLGQEVPENGFTYSGRRLFAAHLVPERGIVHFAPLETDESDYHENGKINSESRARRAASIFGLLP